MHHYIYAQAAGGSGSLKTGLGIALGIVMAIAFIYGVLLIIGGVSKLRDGDATGKMGIVAGVVLAAAVAIMTALYAAFGLSGSTITPGSF